MPKMEHMEIRPMNEGKELQKTKKTEHKSSLEFGGGSISEPRADFHCTTLCSH